jgi:hypothetical protein
MIRNLYIRRSRSAKQHEDRSLSRLQVGCRLESLVHGAHGSVQERLERTRDGIKIQSGGGIGGRADTGAIA